MVQYDQWNFDTRGTSRANLKKKSMSEFEEDYLKDR